MSFILYEYLIYSYYYSQNFTDYELLIGKIYYEQNLKNYNISECCKSINSYDNIEIDNTLKLSKKKLQIEMKQFMEKTKTFNKITNPEYNNDGEIKDDKNEDVQNEIIKLLLFREALVYAYIRITMFMVGNSLIDKIKNIDDEIFVDIQNKIITLYGIKITRELLLNKYFNLSCDDSMIILCNHIINEMKNGDLISIYDIIEKFLKPNELQKKKNGEVFTPLELIREKCSKVPEEFWRDKNVKVLDPCCGIGNYQVVLIEFFMKGLVEEIPDEKERLYWIKTKILYCTDICSLNVALCKKITGVENVYCVDFLSCSFLDEMKFDMVIGNPPYQDNSGNIGIGHTLWDKFVLKSLDNIKENGMLCFIHPSAWRKANNKTGKVMLKYQFDYIEIHNVNDGKKKFSCSTRYDWYILRKSNIYKKTLIKDEKNNNIEINLKNIPFIPNYNIFEIYSLLAKENEETFNIKQDYSSYEDRKTHVSKIKNEEFKHPVIKYVLKNSNSYIWSNTKVKGHFYMPKIVMLQSNENSFLDINGDYGVSKWCCYIEDTKENLKNMFEVFKTQKFKDFLEAINLDQSKTNMKYLRKDFWKEFIN